MRGSQKKDREEGRNEQMRVSMLVSVAMVVLVASGAEAGIVTQNLLERGWFRSDGERAVDNYIVGNGITVSQPGEFRNYFIIDLSRVTDTVVTARLLLRNPTFGFSSPQGVETFRLTDVVTPIETLRTAPPGTAAAGNIFSDLRTGPLFGEIIATPALNGTIVSVSLTAEGLSSLNAARGGLWAVGGYISTINASIGFSDESLFASTGSGLASDTRIELTTVPGPGAVSVLALAGVLAAGCRRRA